MGCGIARKRRVGSANTQMQMQAQMQMRMQGELQYKAANELEDKKEAGQSHAAAHAETNERATEAPLTKGTS